MAIAAYNSQILVTSQPSVSFTNESMTDAGDHINYTLTNAAKRYLDKSVPVVVQTSPDGTTWTTITTGFTLIYAGAKVIFTSAQPASTQVRLQSGKYFAYATLATAKSCEFSAKIDMNDTTSFNTSGTYAYTPGLLNGTLKLSSWWANITRLQSAINRDLLVVSFVTPTNNRYEGYCYAQDCSLKADVKTAIPEDITFQLTDQFFSV